MTVAVQQRVAPPTSEQQEDESSELSSSLIITIEAPALNVQSMLSFVYDECEMDRVQDSVEQCINGMITDCEGLLELAGDTITFRDQLKTARQQASEGLAAWRARISESELLAQEARKRELKTQAKMTEMRDLYLKDVCKMKEQLHQKKGSADPDSFTPQESDHFQSFLADAEVHKRVDEKLKSLRLEQEEALAKKDKQMAERLHRVNEQAETVRMKLRRQEELIATMRTKVEDLSSAGPTAARQFRDFLLSKYNSMGEARLAVQEFFKTCAPMRFEDFQGLLSSLGYAGCAERVLSGVLVKRAMLPLGAMLDGLEEGDLSPLVLYDGVEATKEAMVASPAPEEDDPAIATEEVGAGGAAPGTGETPEGEQPGSAQAKSAPSESNAARGGPKRRTMRRLSAVRSLVSAAAAGKPMQVQTDLSVDCGIRAAFARRSSMIGIGNGIEQGTDAMPYAIAYPRLPIKSVGCQSDAIEGADSPSAVAGAPLEGAEGEIDCDAGGDPPPTSLDDGAGNQADAREVSPVSCGSESPECGQSDQAPAADNPDPAPAGVADDAAGAGDSEPSPPLQSVATQCDHVQSPDTLCIPGGSCLDDGAAQLHTLAERLGLTIEVISPSGCRTTPSAGGRSPLLDDTPREGAGDTNSDTTASPSPVARSPRRQSGAQMLPQEPSQKLAMPPSWAQTPVASQPADGSESGGLATGAQDISGASVGAPAAQTASPSESGRPPTGFRRKSLTAADGVASSGGVASARGASRRKGLVSREKFNTSEGVCLDVFKDDIAPRLTFPFQIDEETRAASPTQKRVEGDSSTALPTIPRQLVNTDLDQPETGHQLLFGPDAGDVGSLPRLVYVPGKSANSLRSSVCSRGSVSSEASTSAPSQPLRLQLSTQTVPAQSRSFGAVGEDTVSLQYCSAWVSESTRASEGASTASGMTPRASAVSTRLRSKTSATPTTGRGPSKDAFGAEPEAREGAAAAPSAGKPTLALFGAASRMTSKDPYGAEVEAERITPREGAAAAPKLALFGVSSSRSATKAGVGSQDSTLSGTNLPPSPANAGVGSQLQAVVPAPPPPGGKSGTMVRKTTPRISRGQVGVASAGDT